MLAPFGLIVALNCAPLDVILVAELVVAEGAAESAVPALATAKKAQRTMQRGFMAGKRGVEMTIVSSSLGKEIR